MPGRVSARSTQAPQSTKPRSSTAAPKAQSSNLSDEGEHSTLRTQICEIFADAQKSNNGQRKLVVRLRKIQEACCYEPVEPQKKAAQEEFDEHDFNDEIPRCALRVLTVKKSEGAGDRIVRFLGVFLKHATDLDNAIFQQQETDDEQIPQETPTSRLTSALISLLIPILPARDKVVRFRATQIIAHIINTLDSVDQELFYHIRLGLLKRLRDKESAVRVQAVYGLGRLAGETQDDEDDENSDDEGAVGGVLDKLLDILQNDPSAEVRRSLLLNLPFTPRTLPFLLERARDMDAGIRRALYSRLLPALGDFRHLSLTHREKLLRWGLRDRDDHVRKATAKLFRERWIEDCATPRDANGEPMESGKVTSPSTEGLLELLERIDVLNVGNDGGIALDAMKEFWEGRPDYAEFIAFDEAFWKDITPESVFIARTFNDFCQQPANIKKFDDKMPEVTRFAFLLQENVNKLVEMVRNSAIQEDAEEETIQQEFIVEQLLHVALTLDYSDEIGRRTMFSLMRGALALAELPEEATKRVIEVLRTTCGKHTAGERELSGIVLEAIAEVHDNIMGDNTEPESNSDNADVDESFHSAKSEVSDDSTPKKKILDPEEEEERAVREIMVNMKCLHIAQCMLQNVECNLKQNPDVVTLLNNLVVPAVRSMEAPIRERGLLCLGLCCLLDKDLAEENLELFLKCFSKGHEALQIIALQIIGDVLLAHPTLLMRPTSPEDASAAYDGNIGEGQPLRKDIHRLYTKSLKSASPSVQSTASVALEKLMLSSPSNSSTQQSILNQDELLRNLVIAYFDPDTAGNAGLRQSLTYFLPVYCHSRKENMQRMGRIAMSILHWSLSIKDEMEVENEGDLSNEMVGLGVIASHIVDWTDGRRLAAAMAGFGDDQGDETDSDVHLDLVVEILEKVLGVCSKYERKLYISVLGKIHVSPNSDQGKLQNAYGLVQEAIQEKIANDAATRNTLTKIQTALTKAIGQQNSQSPAPSRRTSVAPSNVDGEEEDDTPDSDAAKTPVSSPRKNIRQSQRSPKRSPSRLPVVPESAVEDSSLGVKEEELEEDTTAIIHEMDTVTIEEKSSELPAENSDISNRPRWQISELQRHEEAENPVEVDDDSPKSIEMPPKSPKRRGRPPKAATASTSAAETVVAEPDATQVARPQRRSVRATRRQQSMAADENSA